MASRNYYYFVATLPSINYGDIPPKSSVEFLEECNYMLNPKDAALLPYCRYDPKLAVETLEPTGSDFIDLLMLRERVLALNLAFFRAAGLKRNAPEDPPQDMPRTVAVARAASEMDDPLRAALFIDQARWGALDTMTALDDMFGVDNIFLHLLRLQLLERHQRLLPGMGREMYRECRNAILNEYNSRVKEDML